MSQDLRKNPPREQKLAKHTVINEALFIDCIKRRNFRPIFSLIARTPVDENRHCRLIKMEGGKTVELHSVISSELVLIIQGNYMEALTCYIERWPIEGWNASMLWALKPCLIDAVKNGNQAMVELLLKAKVSTAPFSSGHHPTPLHLAATHGHANLIEPLIQSLKTSQLDESKKSKKSFLSKFWHKEPHEKLLETLEKLLEATAYDSHTRQPWTALGWTIQLAYREATYSFIEHYQRIGSMEEPFDPNVAKEAARQCYAELSGTKIQNYFDVIAKLFEVSAYNPRQSSRFSQSISQAYKAAVDLHKTALTPPSATKSSDLSAFFIKSYLEPHIKELAKRPKYAVAFLAGQHNRTGARSLFRQLERRSTIFESQVLRLPLRLAGAPKKPAVTSAFFLPAEATATASSASSAATAQVDSVSSSAGR